jgi:hypothetical protein
VKGIGSHTRPNAGETNEWLTPPEWIKALGPFDLDPCSPINRPWPTASYHYTIQNNGLMLPWAGFVFCNPPYGRETWKWLQRLSDHNEGIALTFARTETKMFREWVFPFAQAILFVAGRPHFYLPNGTRAKGNSGGPVVLIGYGNLAEERIQRSGIDGYLVRLAENQRRW